MKEKTEEKEIQELLDKYNECKIWHSEIETLENGIQFMKKTIFNFLTKIEEDKRVEIRTFFNEMDGRFRGRLNWLKIKLDNHKVNIGSFYKKNQTEKLLELRPLHDLLKNEIKQLNRIYSSMRIDLFDLLKPCLKKENNLPRVAQAA